MKNIHAKLSKISPRKYYIDLILIVLVVFLSRLPQLTSNNLLLDGDECIVGLMAKHITTDPSIPIYFYGQPYGFSLIETSTIAFFYSLLGENHYAIKLSMLLLWTIGVLFIYKTLTLLNSKNQWLPLLIVLLFVLSPSWAVWSMKARGGYISSFLFSSLSIYLILNPKSSNRFITYPILGFFVILIKECQPLWVLGVMAILFVFFLYSGNVKKITCFIIGLAVGIIFFSFLKNGLSHFWDKTNIYTFSMIRDGLLSLPRNIYRAVNGNYYLGNIFKSNLSTRIFAYSYLIIFYLSIGVGTILFIIKKEHRYKILITLIPTLATLSYTLFLKEFYPRYLLPLFGFSILLLYFLITLIKNKTFKYVIVAFFLFWGSLSIYSFKNYKFEGNSNDKFSGKEQINTIIEFLKYNNTHCTFTTGALFQWQLMFYSDEEIISRYIYSTDRYPEYVKRVNDALENDHNTAFIDCNNTVNDSIKCAFEIDRFKVYLNPQKDFLQKVGFAF